jgi:hypothetical protein
MRPTPFAESSRGPVRGVTIVGVAVVLAACGPKSTARAIAPTAEPCRGADAPKVTAAGRDGPAKAAPEPSAPPLPHKSPGGADPCVAELDVETDAYADSERNAEWVGKVRQSFLPPEQAESVAGPLAWRTVEALMARRFDQVATLVGPDGLCLRAAKGASCLELDARAIARCARSREKYDFPVDSGEDNPAPKTCAEAMDRVFLTRDFRHPTSIKVNCFPQPGRGNNAHSVVQRPAALFVDFHAEQTPWQSLWLIFDGKGEQDPEFCSSSAACDNAGRRLYLVEIMAEYWGI